MFSDTTSKPGAPDSRHSSPYLSWKDRTSAINGFIDLAFKKRAGNTKSEWGLFNGSYAYYLGGIKEQKLMRKLIQKAPRECKDFYALDIGAGNFQWGRALAEYLNTKKDIPKDVTIHIIGIRGETNLDKAVTELGQCKLYEFGQFQIETLIDEFKQRGLDLLNKIDLIVSRWCLRHLVDPVGTVEQALELARPKTGYLLIDGFYFLYENERMSESINFNERMTRLCLETCAPFLTRFYNAEGSLNHFVLNKPDDQPCQLRKQYLGIQELYLERWQIGSEIVTRFKDLKEKDEITPLLSKGDYRGDKGMYEWLRQNGLLHYSDLVWGPLHDKDANKKTPPLHLAIAKGDEEAFYRCLQEGCDINESDELGLSPLHLTIKYNKYKLFSLLLEKGALKKLFAYTPLHLAMQYDFNGCFITDLIAAGVNVNIKPNRFGKVGVAPLDLAIEHKNVKGIELLLAAKAYVNYENRKLLDNDPIFSSIKHLLPKRLSELEGFDTIITHIKNGDRVLLTYPDSDDCQAFQRSTQLEEGGKLILVTVNPETRLLDDGNDEEIKDISGCQMSLEFKKLIGKPDLQLRFGY